MTRNDLADRPVEGADVEVPGEPTGPGLLVDGLPIEHQIVEPELLLLSAHRIDPRSAVPFAGHRCVDTPTRYSLTAPTDGSLKKRLSGTSTPKRAVSCAMRTAASREWPPRSKKLSSTPTRSTPSTSANSSHRICSCGDAGSRPPAAVLKSGAGDAGSTNSKVPSVRHRTSSPLRYIRSPEPNGHATNRCAVGPTATSSSRSSTCPSLGSDPSRLVSFHSPRICCRSPADSTSNSLTGRDGSSV